jgi:hypothetical protein
MKPEEATLQTLAEKHHRAEAGAQVAEVMIIETLRL